MVLVIIFWYFLIFYKIILSLQVKQGVIISNENGIYQLPYEFPNDLKLKMSGNQEILGKSQNCLKLQPSAQSFSQNENFVSSFEHWTLNFFHGELFYMESKVCLKYVVHDSSSNDYNNGLKGLLFQQPVLIVIFLILNSKNKFAMNHRKVTISWSCLL